MIRRIRGRLGQLHEESVLVEVGGFTYEVFLPPHVRERFEGRPPGSEVDLATYYYIQQSDPGKALPILFGFENETQRDFFELLTDVPRMGPRAALRAFSLPVATLARAIELQDTRLLKSLPGVGPQKAKDIVATLAGKLGRFLDAGDLAAGEAPQAPLTDFEADALDVLTQLGMNRAEAIQSIRQVREAHPELVAADEIVREVFRSR